MIALGRRRQLGDVLLEVLLVLLQPLVQLDVERRRRAKPLLERVSRKAAEQSEIRSGCRSAGRPP